MKKLNIGIIGAGRIGKLHAQSICYNVPTAKVLGITDVYKDHLPALCNEFISTVKGTSLASVFFVGELMTSFKTVQSATFLALQSLTIVGIIYFILNFVLSKLLKLLERRLMLSD